MKNILVLLIVTMTFLCSAFEEQKFLPSFVLLEKKPDNTLKVGQSMVSFKIEGVGKITKGQIMVWSANDEVDTSFVQQDHFLHTSLKAGSYSFQFYFNSSYNEIYSPITEIESGYHYTFALHFHQVELQIAEKPVIYLYPERLTKVSVSIETPAEISFVYPAFYKEKTWKVDVTPEGKINCWNQQYNYLFWEATYSNLKELQRSTMTTFYTTSEKSLQTLEYICDSFGLNSLEKADLITYWGPQLQQLPSAKISVLMNEEVDRLAGLTISPEPDHVYRLFLLIDPEPVLEDIPLQKAITPIQRQGFFVIEWGGTIIGNNDTLKL
ncbi:MAG: hypothetical protein EP305_04570 [Bacteroidetes bacterium]|nr:MAG: hypothetical protein EP305_04570 [Bacteroidota bacterium]